MSENIRIDEIKIYRSTDLAISGYLNLYFQFIGMERINDRRYEFLFERSTDLEKAVEAYFSNNAKVNPLAYFNSIKLLKSRIHSLGL